MNAGDAYNLALNLAERGAPSYYIHRRLERSGLPEHIIDDIIVAALDDAKSRESLLQSNSTDTENKEGESE